MEDLLKHTNDMIQRGRLQKAQRRLEDERDDELRQRAEYWRQRLLIDLITGYQRGIQRRAHRGRACGDWDNAYEAEIYLDAARHLLRRIKRFRIVTPEHEQGVRQVASLLGTAELLFGDTARYGEILSLRGRLAYVQQDYKEAAVLFEAASIHLRGEQRHINRLDLLKCYATPSTRRARVSVLKRIAKEEPDWRRRFAAGMIALTGELGCWLHDRFAAA